MDLTTTKVTITMACWGEDLVVSSKLITPLESSAYPVNLAKEDFTRPSYSVLNHRHMLALEQNIS